MSIGFYARIDKCWAQMNSGAATITLRPGDGSEITVPLKAFVLGLITSLGVEYPDDKEEAKRTCAGTTGHVAAAFDLASAFCMSQGFGEVVIRSNE